MAKAVSDGKLSSDVKPLLQALERSPQAASSLQKTKDEAAQIFRQILDSGALSRVAAAFEASL